MSNVIDFPTKPTKLVGWICACGCCEWLLLDNGDVLCPECDHISSSIKVIEIPKADT